MIQYGVLYFRFINVTDKQCFYHDDISEEILEYKHRKLRMSKQVTLRLHYVLDVSINKVPMANNGTIGKSFNVTIGPAPNGTLVCHRMF